MSIHLAAPKILRDYSHEMSIFKQFIDICESSLSFIPSLPKNTEKVSFKVTYNHKKVYMFGALVDTCTVSEVTYFKNSEGCYYSVNTVEDYGDEGDIILKEYYFSEIDLFEQVRAQFDSVELLSA